VYTEIDDQVEERPSITYADVGGCKEQIEKLREVVELPLLEVSSLNGV
jgi:26S proteasome regulatory subunit T1